MLSAHGSAPEVVAAARARGGYVVDAVCPLVTKVHHEVKVRAGKGYRSSTSATRATTRRSARWRSRPTPIRLVETRGRGRRRCPTFDRAGRAARPDHAVAPRLGGVADARPASASPTLWTPGRSDLCFATTNRQAALMAMAPRCDAVVVIG